MNDLEQWWNPTACPIARHQPFGYRHIHTGECTSDPQQLAQGSRDMARWPRQQPLWRRYLRVVSLLIRWRA